MLAIFNMIGGPELVVLLIVGLILFGGRLPDVGKSVGKTLIEFRKGLRDLKKDIGLDEVSDLRRDLGQLTQAHYNLLDVNDDELDDRKESLNPLEEKWEEGSKDEESQETKELENKLSESSPETSSSGSSDEDQSSPQEEGPFAREDMNPDGESLDELGIPLPRSDEPNSDQQDTEKKEAPEDPVDPPKFGYRS